MELTVGSKAIIFNSKYHSDYNFRFCEIENKDRGGYCVKIEEESITTRFWIKETELIPFVFEKVDDLDKYGVEKDDLVDLFNRYKANYECLCNVANGIGDDLNKKEKECSNLNKRIKEMQSHIDCLKAKLEEVQIANQKFREKWKNLGLRCHDSARDLFEKDLCGCLHIVTADELKQKVDFPAEPIKVADMLIHETYTVKKCDVEKALCRAFGNTSDTSTYNVYSVSDLREIAEHLLVYCNNAEVE